MSRPSEEARALDAAKDLLYALGNGDYRFTTVTAPRAEARRISKHYPLIVGHRWMEAHGGTFTEREDIDTKGEA